MKIKANQHFWVVVAQCKNPYREFSHCERCDAFMEWAINKRMTRKEFKGLSIELRNTDNPMYEPDSDRLLVHQDMWVTRTQHINEVNALRSQNKLK